MLPVADGVAVQAVPVGQNIPEDHILLLLVVKGVGLQPLVLHVEFRVVALLVGQTVHTGGEIGIAEEFDFDLIHGFRVPFRGSFAP